MIRKLVLVVATFAGVLLYTALWGRLLRFADVTLADFVVAVLMVLVSATMVALLIRRGQ